MNLTEKIPTYLHTYSPTYLPTWSLTVPRLISATGSRFFLATGSRIFSCCYSSQLLFVFILSLSQKTTCSLSHFGSLKTKHQFPIVYPFPSQRVFNKDIATFWFLTFLKQSKGLVTFETLITILTIENLNSWQSLLPDYQEWHWTAFAILAMFFIYIRLSGRAHIVQETGFKSIFHMMVSPQDVDQIWM